MLTKFARGGKTLPPFLLAESYRDLLDFSRVGDDLLHHLHGLSCAALSLLALALGLGLHDLDLLPLSHLHCHGGGLHKQIKKKQTGMRSRRWKIREMGGLSLSYTHGSLLGLGQACPTPRNCED